MNAKKLLIICGPTATGKTGLGLYLAKVFKGEVVSADSRQVYKDLDIGTGKDLPEKARFRDQKPARVYTINNISVWGYDLVDAKKEYSVNAYVRKVNKIIKDIYKRRNLPILVGGTGLYLKAVVDGVLTIQVPKNKKLRQNLESYSTIQLFEILAQLDAIKAASLNLSDKKNPRRLVRAIEIAQFAKSKKLQERKIKQEYDPLFIGLNLSKEKIKRRIQERIKERINKGLEKEIESLLKNKVHWSDQSMNSLGYKEWKDYFLKNISKKEVLTKWERNELAYVKRQMTWFKKDKRIIWFDPSKRGYEKEVEIQVKKWYK